MVINFLIGVAVVLGIVMLLVVVFPWIDYLAEVYFDWCINKQVRRRAQSKRLEEEKRR